MTLENVQYGSAWLKCARCSVCDSTARRTYDAELKDYVCVDTVRCARWKAELEEQRKRLDPVLQLKPEVYEAEALTLDAHLAKALKAKRARK